MARQPKQPRTDEDAWMAEGHTGGVIDKAERLLGWRPTTGLGDGLAAQVAWQVPAP